MRPVIFFWASLVLFGRNVAYAQSGFHINGKIKGISSGILYIRYDSEGKNIKDSAVIKKGGNFSFSGFINQPTAATLQLNQKEWDERNYTTVFIEPVAMDVSLVYNQFNMVKLSGSRTQKEYDLLNSLKQPIQKQMEPLLKEFNTANEAYRKAMTNKADERSVNLLKEKTEAIREKIEPYSARQDTVDFNFFGSHPHSYVTAYMLQYHISGLSLQQMKDYYSSFNKEVQESIYGKNLANNIGKLEAGSPGAVAKDFSKPGLKGDTIRLSSFRQQKYVLLDFWASWCVPCRKGNPHLKEIYSKYKEIGLEIIGISDDDSNPAKWKKAVEDDGLSWLHVLRGIDWEKIRKGDINENDLSEKYGIGSLPTKILIDKNGIIIGRYNEQEDNKLNEKLKEIFGKQISE